MTTETEITKISELSLDERNAVMTQLADLLKECELADGTKIALGRETVCPLKADSVEDNITLSVSGSFGMDKKPTIDAFVEKAKEKLGKYDVKYGLKCEVGVGQQYSTIEDVTKIESPEEPVKLEHTQGEVWLLDFWATWCPPCQAPMAHNVSMLKENPDWAEKKIRIIGLSIDQAAEAVVKHVEAKEWGTVEHYWRAKSKCSETYSVRGVPHVMLIDQNGKIVFKGHPAGRPDLQKDLNDLAEGKELSGDGDKAEAGAGGEGEAAAAVDAAAMHAEIDEFKATVGPALQKDLKEEVEKFPRAFCVMVASTELNPATGASKTTYDNYRVLVGPKDNLEKVKEHLQEKVKGGFKVVLREHAL